MEQRGKQRVLITGATGLIGSHLVAYLSERGYLVVALARNPEEDRRKVPKAERVLAWHARSTEGEWRRGVADADIVVNLAGAPLAQRWTDEARREIHASRVLGTRSLVEAMSGTNRAGRPQVLINGSAVGYYGLMRTEPVDESASPGDGFPSDVCVAWEEEAMRAEEKGARVVRIRSGVVLHPEGGALAEMLPPFRMFVGGPIGGGDQPWPWIHMADELGLIAHAITTDSLRGPLNAVAPQQITNAEFADALGETLRRPSLIHAPRFVLRAKLGEAAAIVTGGQNVIPAVAQKSGYSYRFSDIREALADLLD